MFDPAEHPGLSDRAAALSPETLMEHARRAERLLRVSSADYDALAEPYRSAWADMVVLQLNFGLERSLALVSTRLGDVQQTFRDAAAVCDHARIIRDAWFSGADASDGSWGLSAVYEDER